MANGLGRMFAGAVLQGAGAGILQRAQERRQDTLLRIRRQSQQQDRAEDRAHAIEDRADARVDRALIPTVDPDTGASIYSLV